MERHVVKLTWGIALQSELHCMSYVLWEACSRSCLIVSNCHSRPVFRLWGFLSDGNSTAARYSICIQTFEYLRTLWGAKKWGCKNSANARSLCKFEEKSGFIVEFVVAAPLIQSLKSNQLCVLWGITVCHRLEVFSLGALFRVVTRFDLKWVNLSLRCKFAGKTDISPPTWDSPHSECNRDKHRNSCKYIVLMKDTTQATIYIVRQNGISASMNQAGIWLSVQLYFY